MEYDREKVDEMVLALLWLTAFEIDEDGARAWKSFDWDAVQLRRPLRQFLAFAKDT